MKYSSRLKLKKKKIKKMMKKNYTINILLPGVFFSYREMSVSFKEIFVRKFAIFFVTHVGSMYIEKKKNTFFYVATAVL